MLKLFVLMLMTFILVSCGGGKSTATLSISRGMVFGNTSFSGGIYITGEKVGGTETFSAAITTGNQTSVSIPFGNWNFKVVGWDGGGVMSGTAYCKYVPNYSFTTEGQALEITTTATECFSDSNISATSQQVTANVGPYKDFIINTCGALYGPSNTSLLHAYGAFNPCDSYPVEFKKTYPYFQFHLVNQTVGGSRTPGIVSGCLGTQVGQNVLFPNRLPVTIKFYKDAGCTTELDEYVFKKALDFSQSPTREANSFDWSVTSDTVHYFVTVATGPSKRGTTAFHSETPVFKCSESGALVPCTKFPTTAANTYYLDLDTYAVVRIPQGTCGTITSTGVSIITYSCDVYNGSAYVGLRSLLTTPATGSMSMNGVSYTVKVGNSAFSQDRIRDAYKTMKRTLGYRNTSSLNDSLADDFDEEDNEKVGILDSAIFDLSPMGSGGVFFDYFNQCSTGALTPVTRSYVKNGITYSVSLSGISGAVSGFTAHNDDPEFIGTETRFNRRIIVRKLLGGSLTTEKIIDVSCDNDTTSPINYVSTSAQTRNGRIEEQRSWLLNTKTVNLKKIILWNTSSSNTARFDVYKTKSYYIGTTPQKIERNFYRVAKSLSDTTNHFKVHGMTYITVREGSAFNESILVSEVDGKDTSGTVTYSHKRGMDLKLEAGTIGTIFDTTFAAEMNKVRFGYHINADEQEQASTSSVGQNFVQAKKDPTYPNYLQIRYTDSGTIASQTESFVPDNIATDISPDGTKKIVAANYQNTIHYYYISNSIVTPGTITATNDPQDIKVGIRDDGAWVVSYIDSVDKKVYWKNSSTTTYSSPYALPYESKGLSVVKDSSQFYLHFRRTNNNISHYIEICKASNGACNGYTSRLTLGSTEFTYASLVNSAGTLHATYINNGTLFTNIVDPGTLYAPSEAQPTQVRKFLPFLSANYTPLDSTTALRATAGTNIDIDFPYYSPTMPNFEMKPSHLKPAFFDAFFSSTFATQTN